MGGCLTVVTTSLMALPGSTGLNSCHGGHFTKTYVNSSTCCKERNDINIFDF